MKQIVDLQMKEVRERLKEHGLEVQLSETARDWLAKVGYDQNFGARPLKRAIQKHLESPLSVKLLAGLFQAGDLVLVDVDEGKQELAFQQQEKTVHTKEKSKKKTEETE